MEKDTGILYHYHDGIAEPIECDRLTRKPLSTPAGLKGCDCCHPITYWDHGDEIHYWPNHSKTPEGGIWGISKRDLKIHQAFELYYKLNPHGIIEYGMFLIFSLISMVFVPMLIVISSISTMIFADYIARNCQFLEYIPYLDIFITFEESDWYAISIFPIFLIVPIILHRTRSNGPIPGKKMPQGIFVTFQDYIGLIPEIEFLDEPISRISP